MRLRQVMGTALVTVLVLIAGAGCAGEAPPAATPEPGQPAGGPFPVTVAHGLGGTTVPRQPRRIVAIGGNDADALYALGVTPVAVLGSRGTADGIPPWLRGRLDPKQTAVLSSTEAVNLEHLAALRPDLILAGSVPNIADEYAKLSRIAPTITYAHGVLTDSWEERLRLAARAVGLEPRAEQLITETQRRITGFLGSHPGLEGKTISIAWANQPGSLAVLGGDNNTTDLLRALGLRVAPGVRDINSNTLPNASTSLSPEQWSRLDADVVLVGANSPDLAAAVRDSPLIRALPAIARGTYQEVDISLLSALRVPSVLNVNWVVDQITPTLTRAAT